jgi:predicted Zn-dependent peptidase
MFKKTTLKNGLRVITIPFKHSKSVTTLILVGTGSKYEKKEISGVSHFLEHMCFKGTKKQPSPIAVSETLDNIGGAFNAFTSQDYTGYYAKVASHHFDTALDWVSDIYLNSVFPKEELEKEKGVIEEEFNMYHDQPMQYVGFLWGKLLYGDQPAGWNVLGTKKSIRNMTRKKILDYVNSQYTALNTIVCVAGNIKEEEVIKKVDKIFSKLRTNKTLSKKPVKEKQSEPNLLFENRDIEQSHICLGVRGYNLDHPDRYIQDLLSIILGGMMSSRLFVEIREKMGAAYYVSAGSSSDPDTGFLFARAGVDYRKERKVIETILREFKKIADEKISSKELKKAKEYIKGKTALGLESSHAQASFYSKQELLKNNILTPEEIFKKINLITEEDIQRVAQDLFRSEKLNLAMITPSKNKKEIKKIIKKWN